MGLSYACVTVSVQIPLRVIQVVDISDNPNSPFTEKGWDIIKCDGYKASKIRSI